MLGTPYDRNERGVLTHLREIEMGDGKPWWSDGIVPLAIIGSIPAAMFVLHLFGIL